MCRLWDEFHPAMLRLDLKLEATAGGSVLSRTSGRSSSACGISPAEGNRLNDQRQTRCSCGAGSIAANYPLTGYPPMDKAGWLRVLSILKDRGALNHVRFHSWCPPEAAFEAADELGVYFQAELPNKRSGFNAPEDNEAAQSTTSTGSTWKARETKVSLYDYAKREGELIFKALRQPPVVRHVHARQRAGPQPGHVRTGRPFQDRSIRATSTPRVQQHALESQPRRGRRFLGNRQGGEERQAAARARSRCSIFQTRTSRRPRLRRWSISASRSREFRCR